MDALCIWLSHYFWQLCWGKLIADDTALTWKCFLCRPIKIKYSEIKAVSVKIFDKGNAVRHDLYHTGFQYLLILSEGTIPDKRIDKIRCKRGLIKFSYSKELEALIKKKRALSS